MPPCQKQARQDYVKGNACWADSLLAEALELGGGRLLGPRADLIAAAIEKHTAVSLPKNALSRAPLLVSADSSSYCLLQQRGSEGEREQRAVGGKHNRSKNNMTHPSMSFQLEQRRDSSCLTRMWDAAAPAPRGVEVTQGMVSARTLRAQPNADAESERQTTSGRACRR